MNPVRVRFKLVLFCLLFACFSCRAPKEQTSNCSLALERLPGNSVYAYTYRCKDMVQCVNTLRRAGKTGALQVLQEYTFKNPRRDDPLQEDKLIYLCNMLFINPEGWVRLGGEPETDEKIAKSFPSFPIAISDGVPFLLIEGYVIDGVPGISGAGQVRKCEAFQLIDRDLPAKDFKKAALDLIHSESFQKLYKDPHDKERMAQEVLNQAN